MRGAGGGGRGGSSPPLQAEGSPGEPPPRGRAFRGGPTGRSLQPVLCVGSHLSPVPSNYSQLCPQWGGPPDARPLVPCGGVPCQAGPRMYICGGQVQKLLGSHLSQANVCPGKREARRVAKGWRPPSPPRRERRESAPPEEEAAESPVMGEEGEVEVDVQPGA